MSRTNRAAQDARRKAARSREFVAANTGWTEQLDRRLVPGQTFPVPLDAVGPESPAAIHRVRVRCKECGQILGIVFDWSTDDGMVSARKLVTNGGHALLNAETRGHRFTFSCCSWSASRTGADLEEKEPSAGRPANIQLP